MKRKMILGICTSLLTLSVVGCSSNDKTSQSNEEASNKSQVEQTKETTATLQDGTYEVETKDADDNGGKARVSLVIKDGKINEAKYNEFTDKGNKREDDEYNKMMKEQAGVSPKEFEPQIEEQVIQAQSIEIDGVSGATGSSEKAKSLFSKALENAKAGKTDKDLM